MLILTRKKNQMIHIGDEVTITVLRVSGNKVRLGVCAPRELSVMRIELERTDDSNERQIEAAA